MTSYKIWDRFTEPERRAAAEAVYAASRTNRWYPSPRTGPGRMCPLGVALRKRYPRRRKAAPDAMSVALMLGAPGCVGDARAFIADWDSGHLAPADLPAAILGEAR